MSAPVVRYVIVAALSSASGCLSDGPPASAHQRIESELRRSCIAQAGGPRMDAVELLGGRINVACTRWAHRQAKRLAPP